MAIIIIVVGVINTAPVIGMRQDLITDMRRVIGNREGMDGIGERVAGTDKKERSV
jgi:hypothetical protein